MVAKREVSRREILALDLTEPLLRQSEHPTCLHEYGTTMNADLFLNARTYGFSTNKTGAQNAAALTKAVSAGVAANKALVIAAGTFDIDINNTQNMGAVPVNGTVTIRGSGQGQTIL